MRAGHTREEDTPVRRAFGVHGRWLSQGAASRLGYVKTVVMASKRCTLDTHGWEVRHCPAMVKSILGGVRWRLRQRHVSGLSYSTYTLLPPWRTNITYGSSLGGRGLSLGLFGRRGLSLVPHRASTNYSWQLRPCGVPATSSSLPRGTNPHHSFRRRRSRGRLAI